MSDILQVTDTETTGIDDLDQVIELAVVPVRVHEIAGVYVDTENGWDQLIKPNVPIHPAARGAHHITDKELETAPNWSDYLKFEGDPFDIWGKHRSVFVAHNAEYDLRLINQTVAANGTQKLFLPDMTIDTFRVAKHIWEDAPGFANQTLRYWRGLDEKFPELPDILRDLLFTEGKSMHRALPDAVVTAYLVADMLSAGFTVQDLIDLTEFPILQKMCFMPKHSGKTWEEVARIDPGYCSWMLSQGPVVVDTNGKKTGFDDETRFTLKYHLGLLTDEEMANVALARSKASKV